LNRDIEAIEPELAHLTQHLSPVPASEAVDVYCRVVLEITIVPVLALFVRFMRGATVEALDDCVKIQPYIITRPVPVV
jgi:hypothetical protein